MTWADMVFLVIAGVAAGALNTIVAGGSLISFPALVWLGYPPVWANVINSLGLLPGGISGAYGYRTHLPKNPALIGKIIAVAVVGALIGSALLLTLPARFFTVAAPVLILAASVLVAVQPLMIRRAARATLPPHEPEPVTRPAEALAKAASGPSLVKAASGPTLSGAYLDAPAADLDDDADAHTDHDADHDADDHATAAKPRPPRSHRRLGPWALMLATSVYGGYWVVALGVMLFSVFNATFPRTSLQQINALKILTAATINVTGTVVFVATGHLLPVWEPVLLLGGGAVFGGWLGAILGKRLEPTYLRGLVFVTGLFSAGWLVTT
ncbi:sulfite exporter TauE/SafE family protein [Actinomadura alba]|uniref:Probable membrane transporter protein n=1 Tax=Actinomadura alba TaxID=406431 RepID=A0ABR7LV99_9ACTN|nr:sulfite exporter TauE/SafE family protein [Actinomadura alba]MBC6468772.1 sulfite exporter TauE/SafE family protein [Actinomadura alba]